MESPSSSTNDRQLESLKNRAASKIIWGESEESVYRFLRQQGVATQMADEFIQAAMKERTARIRKKSMIRLIAGGIATLIFGSILIYLYLLQADTGAENNLAVSRFYRAILLVGAATLVCGLYSLKHLWLVITGKSLGSAVEDGT